MGVITKIGWGGKPWPSKLIFSSVSGRPCRWPLILFLSSLPKSGLGTPTEDPRKTHGCLRGPQGPNPGSEGARPTRSKHVIKNVILVRGLRKSWALGVRPRFKSSKLCERVYKSRVWGLANIWNLRPNRQFPLDICNFRTIPMASFRNMWFRYQSDYFI